PPPASPGPPLPHLPRLPTFLPFLPATPPPPPQLYTLSLHDALPIWPGSASSWAIAPSRASNPSRSCSTVARRPGDWQAREPNHSPASFSSPSTEIHSAAAFFGIAS